MSSLLFNVYSSLSNHHSSAFDLNSIHSTKVDAPHVEYTNIYLPYMYIIHTLNISPWGKDVYKLCLKYLELKLFEYAIQLI